VGDNRGCFVFDVLTVEFGRNSLENVFYIDFDDFRRVNDNRGFGHISAI
jgi:GGDEF domain-containing protein